MHPSFDPQDVFGNFPVARYRINVKLSTPSGTESDAPASRSPAAWHGGTPDVSCRMYWGSAWRGLLGWELQRLLCPFPKRPQCKQCLIRKSCPYFRLMEDQSDERGNQEMPRGYVLYPEPNGSNESLRVFLTLFGEFTRYAPAVLKALQCGESTGIGAGRIPYRLLDIFEILPHGQQRRIPPDFENAVDFGNGALLGEWIENGTPSQQMDIVCRMTTPVRLRKKGKYLGQMDWPYFFTTLIRRIESLELLFGSGKPLGKDRFLALASRFSDLRPKSESLTWYEYSRWSNRQRKKVPMGGLIGEAIFADTCCHINPWLALAEIVHVGKGASMGLGKIEVGSWPQGSCSTSIEATLNQERGSS